jgi:hypothetical protein
MTTFFSIDVETTATTVSEGQLLTIGVAPVVQNHDLAWAVHPASLYLRLHFDEIRLAKQGEMYSSMPWWKQQSVSAYNEAFSWGDDDSVLRVPRDVAADRLRAFVEEIEPDWFSRIFVANPVSFDKPWIDHLFAEEQTPSPFHYRSLCLRSMRFGMDVSAGFGASLNTFPAAIPHHALHDATAQAYDLISMLHAKPVA